VLLLLIITFTPTVVTMEYCVYCTEEIGVLTKIKNSDGVIEVYICHSCSYHISGI